MRTKESFSRSATIHSFSAQIIIAVLFIILVSITTGCGKDTLPQPPESLIKYFLIKEERMVDSTIVELYVQDEQETISKMIDEKIAHAKATGKYENLMNSNIDLSNLQMKTVAVKEANINHILETFLQVSVKGEYTITEKSEDPVKKSIDDVMILQKENGKWKITRTINPWK